MVIHGSLVHTGNRISIDDFLTYLSVMIPDGNVYKRESLCETGISENIDWLCVLHDCEYLANKTYLIGQTFWLAYRKFLNPLYEADPQSAAGITIDIPRPSGGLSHIILDRKYNSKLGFLEAIEPELNKINRTECMIASKNDLAEELSHRWRRVKA